MRVKRKASLLLGNGAFSLKGLIILVTGVRGISRIVITRFTLDTKLFTGPDNRIGDNRSDQTNTNTPHTSPTGHFTIGQPFFENIREVASFIVVIFSHNIKF